MRQFLHYIFQPRLNMFDFIVFLAVIHFTQSFLYGMIAIIVLAYFSQDIQRKLGYR